MVPNWFRATVAIGSVVTCAIAVYAKPGLGFIFGVLVVLLNVSVAASTVAIGRVDRSASGADDPTTLNLHN